MTSRLLGTARAHKVWTVVVVILVIALVQLLLFALSGDGDAGVDTGPITTVP